MGLRKITRDTRDVLFILDKKDFNEMRHLFVENYEPNKNFFKYHYTLGHVKSHDFEKSSYQSWFSNIKNFSLFLLFQKIFMYLERHTFPTYLRIYTHTYTHAHPYVSLTK